MNKPPAPLDSIAQHTLKGSAYSIGSSAITIFMGIVRTYLMILFLLPEQIGIAALALLVINLIKEFAGFNLKSAYFHNSERSDAVNQTFYTLRLIIGFSNFLIAIIIAPLFANFYKSYTGLNHFIWAYAFIMLIGAFNQPMVAILEKKLSFRNVAILNIVGGLSATIVGPTMAAMGFGVWAIIAEVSAGALARFVFLYFWLPSFRPRLGLNKMLVKWFWNYGKKDWVNTVLTYGLDSFDDFWTGTSLGKVSLGLYNKAYEFSRYPRRAVSKPLLSVFFPTFAHLQQDRNRLSRAFSQSTSLMIRVGALLSLMVVFLAPEAFRLFMPEAWQPMLLTFQLMIFYIFLDPLAQAAQQLLLACGYPGKVARIRVIQFLFFVPAVILGSAWYGINGVAIAAGLMMLIGTVLLFRITFTVVDYSSKKLWFWPIIAMVIIASFSLWLNPWLMGFPDLVALIIKTLSIPILYFVILFMTEREIIFTNYELIRGLVRRPKTGSAQTDQNQE